jgi:hypothetical protein
LNIFDRVNRDIPLDRLGGLIDHAETNFQEENKMTNIPSNTDGGLITAENSAVVFIDHQPQMTFGVANIERQQLVNNVVMLAKGAREFGVPAILTAVETASITPTQWFTRHHRPLKIRVSSENRSGALRGLSAAGESIIIILTSLVNFWAKKTMLCNCKEENP